MTHREQLIAYIHENLDPEFEPDEHALTQVLDSVSLLQLITFIDQELGVSLDLSGLTLDMFASIDSVVAMLAPSDTSG